MTAKTKAPKSELDVLDPVPDVVTLTGGLVVEVEELRTRQFFRLLRILTRGAGPLMADFSLDVDDDEFGAKMMALVIMAVPEAEDETIDFLNSMVRPAGLVANPRTPGEKQANEEKWVALRLSMDNPELDDTVTLIEAVIRREAKDIQSLGKRIQSMMEVAEKTGQIPSPTNSSAGSAEPSTSSQPNTDGQTPLF